MARKYSEAKLFIMQAKRRLINNEYEKYAQERKANFYINNKKLSFQQYEEMCRIVKEIAASEEFISDTLNKLVPDKKEFNKLNECDKVKYMLQLSEVYKTIKKNI